MQLKEQILREHSKANCLLIVQWVGSSQQRFDELFNLFLGHEYRLVQRTAWPVSYCVEAYPQLMKKHFGRLVKKLQEPSLYHAVRRNSVRFLQHVSIPRAYQGAVMDICIRYVASPNEPVSVKAFSLTVLRNLARLHPDIVPEIKLLIEDQLPRQGPSFAVRALDFLESVDELPH
jgi:hypothetical protein